MTLSNEQIEDVLQGSAELPDDATDADRARLAEARALRDRLRAAMASVRMPDEVGDRVRQAVREQAAGQGRTRVLRLPRPVRYAAAVAAMVAVAIGLVLLMPPAKAAQAELAQMHHRLLDHRDGFQPADDPAELADTLASDLGYAVHVPRDCEDAEIEGGCVERFMDHPAGAYLLRYRRGRVSVVVTTVRPEEMNLSHHWRHRGRMFHRCGYGECRIVAVVIDGRTYLVVGEMGHDKLLPVLESFLPPEPAAL